MDEQIQNELTIADAMIIIEQVCSKYVGNLNDHQAIQKALMIIKTNLENKDK
jgi:hypothetical protein